MASGVVRTTGRTPPPTLLSTVPSRPGLRPAASSTEWRRNAVVVFPLVPVTPATSSSRVGSPKKTSAAVAIAARADGTTSWGYLRLDGPLDDEDDGSVLDRLYGEVVAVCALAGNGEEGGARRDGTCL